MKKTSLDKRDIKILLLEGVHPSAVESFEQDGYTNIEYHDQSLSEDELMQAIQDAFFVGIRSRTQLTGAVLSQARRLVGIGCFCIGTNQVDILAAMEQGVPVFNAPFSNTRSVAELTLAEIIMLLRGIPAKSADAHRGVWRKSAAGSFEARGKRLGVVGYGHIGSQLSVMAEALGMQVQFYDIVNKLSLGNAQPVRSLDRLLETSDVVSLHVPQTPQTRNMIGAEQLARMRPGAILLNASRGTVVDIEALARVLREGHLAGAAIDVFPVEPKSNSEPFVSPLQGLDNVILTPHVGGSTLEAQESIGREVADKLITYSNNGSTVSAVNFPEVSLPTHAGCHRLLHIHRNEPGILYQVNEIFSKGRLNIGAQYLQTNEHIGYVVIDVEVNERESHEALRQLSAIPGTIRTRILH